MAEQSADSDEMLHCRVTIIDGLGNAIIQNYTMPYNINFQGFLDRLQVDTFHPLLKTHDESDYASWAKRLDFLESDKVGITKLESLIEQHKHTDYEKVAEWLWICKDRSGDIGGRFIAGEKDLKAFMALAKSKKLGHGCLMRVSLRDAPLLRRCLPSADLHDGIFSMLITLTVNNELGVS